MRLGDVDRGALKRGRLADALQVGDDDRTRPAAEDPILQICADRPDSRIGGEVHERRGKLLWVLPEAHALARRIAPRTWPAQHVDVRLAVKLLCTSIRHETNRGDDGIKKARVEQLGASRIVEASDTGAEVSVSEASDAVARELPLPGVVTRACRSDQMEQWKKKSPHRRGGLTIDH
eukprot:5051428-Prymnesium_polylepis.1